MATRDIAAARRRSVGWRVQLRRNIVTALFIKLLALLALWLAFFSPAHRPSVTPEAIDTHLAVEAAAAGAPRREPSGD